MILVRYPTLPASVLNRLRRSSRLDQRCFGAWFSGDDPTKRSTSDARLFRLQSVRDDAPFREILPAVRERMILSPEALSTKKKAYRKTYREIFLAALEHYWTYIPLDQRYEVDFDGDGVTELVAAARIPDGWDVGRSATLVGGWVWEQSFYWDEGTLNAPPALAGRRVFVAPDPGTGQPLVVVRSTFNPTRGGKSHCLTTALATRLDVVSYTEAGSAEVATVLVRGNGW